MPRDAPYMPYLLAVMLLRILGVFYLNESAKLGRRHVKWRIAENKNGKCHFLRCVFRAFFSICLIVALTHTCPSTVNCCPVMNPCACQFLLGEPISESNTNVDLLCCGRLFTCWISSQMLKCCTRHAMFISRDGITHFRFLLFEWKCKIRADPWNDALSRLKSINRSS